MSYVAFFVNPVPEQISSLLSGYLDKEGDSSYVFCTEWTQNGSFIYLELENFDGKNWKVNLPVHYVAMIADHSEERKIGFQFQTQ